MRDAIDSGLKELAERDRAILRALYLDGREKDDISGGVGYERRSIPCGLVPGPKNAFVASTELELKRKTTVEH